MSCAAEASDYVVPANYYLGLFYQNGFGSISKDLVKALSCFQTAMKSMSSKYADAATQCYEKIASKFRFKASAAQIWAAIAGVLGVIELLDAFGIVDISDLLVNIFK